MFTAKITKSIEYANTNSQYASSPATTSSSTPASPAISSSSEQVIVGFLEQVRQQASTDIKVKCRYPNLVLLASNTVRPEHFDKLFYDLIDTAVPKLTQCETMDAQYNDVACKVKEAYDRVDAIIKEGTTKGINNGIENSVVYKYADRLAQYACELGHEFYEDITSEKSEFRKASADLGLAVWRVLEAAAGNNEVETEAALSAIAVAGEKLTTELDALNMSKDRLYQVACAAIELVQPLPKVEKAPEQGAEPAGF